MALDGPAPCSENLWHETCFLAFAMGLWGPLESCWQFIGPWIARGISRADRCSNTAQDKTTNECFMNPLALAAPLCTLTIAQGPTFTDPVSRFTVTRIA